MGKNLSPSTVSSLARSPAPSAASSRSRARIMLRMKMMMIMIVIMIVIMIMRSCHLRLITRDISSGVKLPADSRWFIMSCLTSSSELLAVTRTRTPESNTWSFMGM